MARFVDRLIDRAGNERGRGLDCARQREDVLTARQAQRRPLHPIAQCAAVERLQRERGFALVLVTHNERLASACDRVLGPEDGQLVSLGAAETREYFEGLANRVDGLAPRIEAQKMQIADTMAEQRAFLQAIAVGELQAQKRRLDIYTVQARFALAAIYDMAAAVGELSQ